MSSPLAGPLPSSPYEESGPRRTTVRRTTQAASCTIGQLRSDPLPATIAALTSSRRMIAGASYLPFDFVMRSIPPVRAPMTPEQRGDPPHVPRSGLPLNQTENVPRPLTAVKPPEKPDNSPINPTLRGERRPNLALDSERERAPRWKPREGTATVSRQRGR